MAGKTAILSVKIIGDEKSAVQSMRNTEKAGEKFSKSFDKMADAATIGGAAAGAALTAAYLGAVSAEGGQKKLTDQLGLSAAESKTVGAVSGSLFADGYGESLVEVNGAISAVVGNIDGMRGATEEALAGVSAKVLNVSDTFDKDLGATTTAVGQLMRTGLATDADNALDIITAGLQSNSRAGEDLLDTFTEYPALFQQLGLSGEQATGLIAQGLDAGARSTDLVADALKEFGIRSKDASETSAAGYAALGLDAEAMTATMAAGGAGAAAGLDQVLDSLRGMTDPVAQNAAAVALFGTQAEDLGGALYALDPSSAVAALGDVAGAAGKLGTTEAETALTSFGRTIQTTFTDMAAQAIPTITPILTALQEFAPILGPLTIILGLVSAAVLVIAGAMKVYAAIQAIQTALQWASNAAWLASPITWIILAIIVALAAVIAIVVLVITHWDQIAAKGAEVWQGIITWLISVAEYLNLDVYFEMIKTALGAVGDVATTVWDGMVTGISNVIGWIQDAIGWFASLFGAQDESAGKSMGGPGGGGGDSSAQRVADAPATFSRMSLAIPEDTSTMRLAATTSSVSPVASLSGSLARSDTRPTVVNNYNTTVQAGLSRPDDVARTLTKVLKDHSRKTGSRAAAGGTR